MTRTRWIMLIGATALGAGIVGYARTRALRRKRALARVDTGRGDAVPEDLDTVETSPIRGIRQVIELEAELPLDGSILDLTILDPAAEPVGVTAVDARPDDLDRVVAEMFEAADDRAQGTHQGDDRADGENWVEDLLVDSAMGMPAERPLYVPPHDAAPRRR